MSKNFWRGFFSVFSTFLDSQERDLFAKEKFKVKILSNEEAFQADAAAIRSDWEAVGKCLLWAAKEVKIHDDTSYRK